VQKQMRDRPKLKEPGGQRRRVPGASRLAS
jgi:hypothetical protein